MEKKLNRPHDRCVRLETPTGLIGVPPEISDRILLVARLTDYQLGEIISLVEQYGKTDNLPQ